ncbi:type I phosphomannose isomerase catalytic subunit [Bacteroidetes bacterium endosymbiont of Geopemphigus sp.]|uniref:type I phosphomannose isomerase catalytic subunit n=1 Tax=Bacteroidetes bacterium endosymbiont of Geopemphigus sp. TaxID=2047937 RepID=UPI000CD2B5E9|nr:type I phosphomannose isomerase catalytic subunit [Bacteroidetes bacterium endosymbiont of Geopemphigus sp.]
MQKNLYPLRFEPFFQYRIWGGDQLRKLLKKPIPSGNIGESWEISDVQSYLSVVTNGSLAGRHLKELITLYKEELLGEKVYERFGNQFPLLIKFIDAHEKLSIQVHPDDKLAKQRHNSFGKNEMWYIMHTEESAELIVGFKENISKENYRKLTSSEKEEVLNKVKVQKGQVYYLPAGRIHAIGAGVLLVEIQQRSDITYRIYDYNRKDKNGQIRELHTELALDAIDFSLYNRYDTPYKIKENLFSKIIDTSYFKIKILSFHGKIKKKYEPKETFRVFIVVEGNLEIKTSTTTEKLKIGDTLLLPAFVDEVHFISAPGAKVLEASL